MAEPATLVTVKTVNEVTESPTKQVPGGTLSVDAFHNFLAGKRHILVQDYPNAALSLAKACELYVEHYGETALECAEVYFCYGKALFRLFQQQAGIIEDVLPDESPDEEEEEENNEESASEEDKEKENTKEDAENTNEDTSNGEEGPTEEEDIGEESKEDSDSKDESNDVKEESSKENVDSKVDSSDNKVENNVPAISQAMDISDGVSSSKLDPEPLEKISEPSKDTSKNSEVSSIEKNGELVCESNDIAANNVDKSESITDPEFAQPGPSTSKPKTEDEISDLQLAWETLETSKAIFQRHSDGKSESELRISEILLILAEISLELENYSSAIEDLKECLKIRHHHMKPDDRHIAETFYQMGLVYTFDNQFELAIDAYERSMDVITLRICNLKRQTVIEQNEDGFDIDPAIEVAELEAIIPDIKGKLEDTHEMIRDAKKLLQALAFQQMSAATNEGFPDSSSGSSSSGSAKPVSNITHLLKRKKPEDIDITSSEGVKKIKLNVNAANGDSEADPDSTSSPPKT